MKKRKGERKREAGLAKICRAAVLLGKELSEEVASRLGRKGVSRAQRCRRGEGKNIIPDILCTMNQEFPEQYPPEKSFMHNLTLEITATYYSLSPPLHRLQAPYKYDSGPLPK